MPKLPRKAQNGGCGGVVVGGGGYDDGDCCWPVQLLVNQMLVENLNNESFQTF